MTKKFRCVDDRVELCATDNPTVTCTKLPEFWRANKKFSTPFTVHFADSTIAPDGTKVTISAANHKNNNPEIRNNETVVINGMARFNDLRFVGKSGRDTKFDVFIHLKTDPAIVFTYKNAIKVTVDGPRPPRPKNDKPLPACLPFKRKLSEVYSAFDPVEKRIRPEEFYNFPIHLLTNVAANGSMPTSPSSIESYSPSHQYMPLSPESYVSNNSETRSSSANSSVHNMSPNTLPIRKRLAFESFSRRNEEDPESMDLSDLIDTARLKHQPFSEHLPRDEYHQALSDQARSPDHSQHLIQNILQNSRLDLTSILSAIPPENHLYFLWLLNYHCNNSQPSNQAHLAPPDFNIPYSSL